MLGTEEDCTRTGNRQANVLEDRHDKLVPLLRSLVLLATLRPLIKVQHGVHSILSETRRKRSLTVGEDCVSRTVHTNCDFALRVE